MIHIAIVTQRGGRRINDALGSRYNLCGATPTDKDVNVRDARACLKDPEWAPRVCVACVEKLTSEARK